MYGTIAQIIREDEPKVEGLTVPSLLKLERLVDHTSGRNFGPGWTLSRGFMPLSYWAMHQKVQQNGFPNLFQSYLEKALEQPIFLGHELSILAGNWQFYTDIIEPNRALFIQRFTDFAVATFAHANDTTFDHPHIDKVPTAQGS